MAVIGDTLPHCTGTGTESDPYIFESEQGFLEAIAVPNAYAEAGVSAMTWDCNNGIITSPIVMYCDSLICKGLTIKNCLIQNNASAIFHIKDKNGGGTDYTNKTINGLNLYNFCIINSGIAFYLFNSEGRSGDYRSTITLRNCNFAGICIGTGIGDNSYHHSLLGFNEHSTYLNHAAWVFYSCTFNIHYKCPGNAGSSQKLFSTYGSRGAFVGFNNCTICVSCENPNTAFTLSESSTYANNTVFTNDPLNPLMCQSLNEILGYSSTFSGYNYHKMNVQASYGCRVGDSRGLINSDKYICTDTSGSYVNEFTGIVMQEHDPTASDYIYSDANLEAHNFLVGQVIT